MQKNNEQVFDIIFLGLAQNCEIFLKNFFTKIDDISKKKNIMVFIGENGSSDYTFDIIQKKFHQVIFIILLIQHLLSNMTTE